MESAIEATTLLFNIMGGLGLFFTGVGVLWGVTVYRDKEQNYHKFKPEEVYDGRRNKEALSLK